MPRHAQAASSSAGTSPPNFLPDAYRSTWASMVNMPRHDQMTELLGLIQELKVSRADLSSTQQDRLEAEQGFRRYMENIATLMPETPEYWRYVPGHDSKCQGCMICVEAALRSELQKSESGTASNSSSAESQLLGAPSTKAHKSSLMKKRIDAAIQGRKPKDDTRPQESSDFADGGPIDLATGKFSDGEYSLSDDRIFQGWPLARRLPRELFKDCESFRWFGKACDPDLLQWCQQKITPFWLWPLNRQFGDTKRLHEDYEAPYAMFRHDRMIDPDEAGNPRHKRGRSSRAMFGLLGAVLLRQLDFTEDEKRSMLQDDERRRGERQQRGVPGAKRQRQKSKAVLEDRCDGHQGGSSSKRHSKNDSLQDAPARPSRDTGRVQNPSSAGAVGGSGGYPPDEKDPRRVPEDRTAFTEDSADDNRAHALTILDSAPDSPPEGTIEQLSPENVIASSRGQYSNSEADWDTAMALEDSVMRPAGYRGSSRKREKARAMPQKSNPSESSSEADMPLASSAMSLPSNQHRPKRKQRATSAETNESPSDVAQDAGLGTGEGSGGRGDVGSEDEIANSPVPAPFVVQQFPLSFDPVEEGRIVGESAAGSSADPEDDIYDTLDDGPLAPSEDLRFEIQHKSLEAQEHPLLVRRILHEIENTEMAHTVGVLLGRLACVREDAETLIASPISSPSPAMNLPILGEMNTAEKLHNAESAIEAPQDDDDGLPEIGRTPFINGRFDPFHLMRVYPILASFPTEFAELIAKANPLVIRMHVLTPIEHAADNNDLIERYFRRNIEAAHWEVRWWRYEASLDALGRNGPRWHFVRRYLPGSVADCERKVYERGIAKRFDPVKARKLWGSWTGDGNVENVLVERVKPRMKMKPEVKDKGKGKEKAIVQDEGETATPFEDQLGTLTKTIRFYDGGVTRDGKQVFKSASTEDGNTSQAEWKKLLEMRNEYGMDEVD